MSADKDFTKVIKGTKIVLINNSGYPQLTMGKEYEAAEDAEPGIFASRPFVTIINDFGNPSVCHLSRFELVNK